MAITHIGSAAAVSGSVTLPAHQAGDLIVIVAFGNATPPTLPGGFNDGGVNSGTGQTSQIGWKIAASSSETSGSWSFGIGLIAHVYRGALGTRRRGATFGSGTTIGYPALSTMINDGTSWVALFARVGSASSDVQNPPAGVAARANATGAGVELASFDTNAGVSSWSLTNQTVSPSAGYTGISLEIESATPTVYELTVNAASISLSASSVTLKRSLKLTVNAASITLSPQSVIVKKSYLSLLVGTAAITLTGQTVNIAGPTRIQYVGSSINAGTSISSMPAHQAGDLLLITAFRNGSTSAITLPAGFTGVVSGVVGSGSYGLVGYKIATSNAEASGTWTGASLVQVQVYRNVKQSDPIGAVATNANTTSSISYPSVTLEVTSYRSWVATVVGHAAANHSAIGTPPSGSVNRTALNGGGGSMAGNDTGTGVPSFAGGSPSTGGAAGDWFASSIEILFEPPVQRLTVTAGAISLTGASVGLRKSNILAVSSAAVTLSGQSVSLKVSRKLEITAAAVTLAGQSVTLGLTRRIGVTAAAITLAGQSVAQLVTRRLEVAAAPITLTGSEITLFKGFYRSLTVTPGEITLAGQSVGLLQARKLAISPAAITLAGGSIDIRKTRLLTISPAAITLTAGSVSITKAQRLTISPAAIVLTGSAVAISKSLGAGTVVMRWYDGDTFVEGVLKRYSSEGVWEPVTITTT